MLDTNSIDTICHEHLEYYSLKQIKYIADHSNFKIIDIKFNSCNGGSFRIYFAKQTSNAHIECTDLINEILEKENKYGLNDNNIIFETFINNCNHEVKYLTDFIDTVNKNGKKVYIYGASTKGNCLLQYANITEQQVKYAVERNPNKVGKMTNTGIEIISEETMRESPPDYLLVLPWHFKGEILKREDDFLNGGGQFIFPFPHFEIIGSKPKLLITGCDGMISSYLKEQLPEYILYGISRKINSEKNITKFELDLNDFHKLQHCILTIKPDIIIHMASISSSHYAFNHPIETLQTNGILTAQICDIVYKHNLKTKLFNASSSEIYKDHVNYLVQEDDKYMKHLHPYSIAKIMSHTIVEFYRNTYGLPFSNGVIFTTESERKRPEFLLNKVKQHAKTWKKTKTHLSVGSLESYRNILHVSDVVSAICLIIRQNIGDNYLICNDYSVKIYDLVIQIYLNQGIKLEKRENDLYDIDSGLKVVVIEDIQKGFDTVPTNIQGECIKLKNLGWNPNVQINDIL
jgi:GDP-mannose 4,6-dehydratase